MPRALGVIPARYASTRFPGKPLAPLGGRSMLEEVWRRAATARRLARLIVATDDARIAETARGFGAEVALTSPLHASGSDRIAELVERLDEAFDPIVNVQGDEPLLTGTSLDRLVAALEAQPAAAIATLAEPLEDATELSDPNVVKLVAAGDGRALYFSRSPIPYRRGSVEFGAAGYRKHQGLYAYRRAALLALARAGPSRLERAEGLEQLRALEAGYTIQVIESDFRSVAVDTPADLERAARLLAEAQR
ncbi:MAG TPA: 3-deoxy-manno-octulosonate cytidylyltransferase [Candidatus Polarisedimenticolaceae bacterium]|nr:3-deoxy-manno-octulosonate cytidylyltransferase [Candidatus Polarisedimenticolaceae bacterium]